MNVRSLIQIEPSPSAGPDAEELRSKSLELTSQGRALTRREEFVTSPHFFLEGSCQMERFRGTIRVPGAEFAWMPDPKARF